MDLTIGSKKHWMEGYELIERPQLTGPDSSYDGRPFTYRLRAGNYELLPTPDGVYSGTLWYVPHTTELSSDSSTFDTVNRLDDYVIAWAAKLIATKDKNWDLVGECRATLGELTQEIEVLGRSRDENSPPRVIDQYAGDRWGRARRGGRW